MREEYFVELENMVDIKLIKPEKCEVLEDLVRPWIIEDSPLVAKLVRSSLHAGDTTEYVIITESYIYIACMEPTNTRNFAYALNSIKCFKASDITAFGFVMGPPPEIRLMLGDGKRIKIVLDTTLSNSKKANRELMEKIAGSPFLRQK